MPGVKRDASAAPIAARTIPATTSSQKWFAVATSENQTHSG
jgi:hypothetical protein